MKNNNCLPIPIKMTFFKISNNAFSFVLLCKMTCAMKNLKWFWRKNHDLKHKQTKGYETAGAQ